LFLEMLLPAAEAVFEDEETDLGYEVSVGLIFRLELLDRKKVYFLYGTVPVGHDGKEKVVFLPLLDNFYLNIGKWLIRH
jgi:hypothetical protein